MKVVVVHRKEHSNVTSRDLGVGKFELRIYRQTIREDEGSKKSCETHLSPTIPLDRPTPIHHTDLDYHSSHGRRMLERMEKSVYSG